VPGPNSIWGKRSESISPNARSRFAWPAHDREPSNAAAVLGGPIRTPADDQRGEYNGSASLQSVRGTRAIRGIVVLTVGTTITRITRITRIAPRSIKLRAPGPKDFGARVERSTLHPCPQAVHGARRGSAEAGPPPGAIRVIRKIRVIVVSTVKTSMTRLARTARIARMTARPRTATIPSAPGTGSSIIAALGFEGLPGSLRG
jgi:hypothetical protein